MKLHLMLCNPNTIVLAFLLTISITTQVSAQFKFFDSYCLDTDGNYTKDSTYEANLKLMFPYLTHQASILPFDNYTVGDGIDKTYMLYNCRGDLNGNQCQVCVQDAVTMIQQKCPEQKEAIVWYEECMLRYATRDIFAIEDENVYSLSASRRNVSDPEQFKQVLAKTINGLIEQTAYNRSRRGYAIGEGVVDQFSTLYCLTLCTPDILGNQCERCLRAAVRSMAGCCGMTSTALTFVLPSCQVRYDSAPFIPGTGNSSAPFTPMSTPPAPSKGGCNGRMTRSYWDILTVLLFMIASMLLAASPPS